MQGKITLNLRMRTHWVFWPALALWALVPGFGWLGRVLVVVEKA